MLFSKFRQGTMEPSRERDIILSSYSAFTCVNTFRSNLSSYYSGPIGDKFVLWKARRNGGIREPEHRLWLYVVPLLVVPSGLILWGVGAAYHVHWFGLVFAMYMLATCIAVGCQLPVSYCIDSYKDLGADAIVTVIIVRNTMSFAIGYG